MTPASAATVSSAAVSSAPANLAFCNIILTGGAPFGCLAQALTH
jgi:hypothetical protein